MKCARASTVPEEHMDGGKVKRSYAGRFRELDHRRTGGPCFVCAVRGASQHQENVKKT